MSASTRLPAIFSTLTLASSAVALSVSPSLRAHILPSQLRQLVPASFSQHALRVLAALLLFVNLKNIPTTWHFRVLRAIFHQIYLSPATLQPAQLFAPLVTHSWNSPLDCDYNLHKSNSTYFKDLDVSRAHYIGALIRTGLRRLNAGDQEGLHPVPALPAEPAQPGKKKVPQGYIIALGGVACTFRKEIRPLARFEVWTRLLAWDDKWLYVVSHIVRPGAVRPAGYHLQPWKQLRRRGWLAQLLSYDPKPPAAKDDADLKSAVYATSIAKYVCKKGRRTVPPEILLQRSRLLPAAPRPTGLQPPAQREKLDSEVPSGADTPEAPETAGAAVAGAVGTANGVAPGGAADALGWEAVEAMRKRGLKYAAMFDGLTGLHDEFGAQAEGGVEDVLGVYGEIVY